MRTHHDNIFFEVKRCNFVLIRLYDPSKLNMQLETVALEENDQFWTPYQPENPLYKGQGGYTFLDTASETTTTSASRGSQWCRLQ